MLPPGGGKTRVGIEAAERLARRTLVLVPNTAIAGQWLAAAGQHGWATGEDRSLAAPFNVITYQALAVFDQADPDEPEPARPDRQLDRLHPNAVELVQRLRAIGRVTLVLDECHHLLQVWGSLLAEVLALLPEARVVGLTATPPLRLRPDEARLVDRLFGPIAYAASIPAFVRDGHLAPFRELACLVPPTADEADYIAGEALRFAELRADLMAEGFASTGFLAWLDRRFVAREGVSGAPGGTAAPLVSWGRLERDQPALCRAALRAHLAGLMALPAGARVREEHRVPLAAEDWIALLDDYVMGALVRSADPRDAAAVDAVRAAVPSIGYRLTRTGLARTTSPVDRVVARSAAKAIAGIGLLHAEWDIRGDRLRALVVCDHERAAGPVPARLLGVLEPDEGSARMALRRFAADPAVAGLAPVLVSASAVACAARTADRLVPWLRERGQDVTATPAADPATIVDLVGRWSARRWVPLLTAWLEEGHGQVLIGTRGLLGEGWDARRVNVVIDLTSATTTVAVTQIRGRALRQDPADPMKVAHTWSVACIADGHPKGDADYLRLVRKHEGFFAVTPDGAITDGIAHVDPGLSPYRPPTEEERAALGRRMLAAARDPGLTRELWQVGRPYADQPVREVRARLPRGLGIGVPAVALGRPDRLTIRVGGPSGRLLTLRPRRWAALRSWLRGGSDLLAAEDTDPAVASIAAAVAAGLAAAGVLPEGGEVCAAPGPDGAYRLWLDGVPAPESALFADALDEVLSPMADPRYVVPRYVLPLPASPRERRRLAWRRLWRRPVPVGVVWHAVPSAAGGTRQRATAFASSWHAWVSPGEALFTGSPEGAGVLAAQRGADPFAVTTALRTEWR